MLHRHRFWVITSLALLMTASTGCVTSSKYDELSAQYQASQSELEKARRQIGGLEGDLTLASDQQTRLSGNLSEKERALAEKDRALAAIRAQEAQAERRIAQFQELTDKFKSLVDAGKLKVSMINGRMVVQMQTDVLFGSGSARLSADGKSAVEEVSGLLSSLADRRYQIEGHTDNVPIKTTAFPSNWELAAARAISVVNVMIENDMAPDRVSAVSYGDTTPFTSNDDADGRAQNRRIEIVLVPDLSQLPGFEELQKISTAPSGS